MSPAARFEVELTPLREAFLASGESAADVARRLGWYNTRGFADVDRVRCQLGLKRGHWSRNEGRRKLSYFRQRTSYARAVELARAIGVDPVEVGL